MSIDDFFNAIREANSRRPGSHTFHPGADPVAIERWQQAHQVSLPRDLIELLKRSNGVDLHQDWYEGEPLFEGGAFRLFPLDRIAPAARIMHGGTVGNEQHPWWYAIGEGPDGALYFVFDVRSLHYLSVSPIVPDEAEDMGPSVDPILKLIDPENPDWSIDWLNSG